MKALNKILSLIEKVNHFTADTCHNVHIAEYVRAIGNLYRHFDQEEPTGPIEKGMTYNVRPFIHP